MLFKRLILLFLALSLVGCATTKPFDKTADKIDQMSLEMNEKLHSKIGIMTYDDAISKLGQPTKETEGDNVFVVEYIGKFERMILTFDKNTRILKDGNYSSTAGNAIRVVGKSHVASQNAALAGRISNVFSDISKNRRYQQADQRVFVTTE